MAEEKTHIITSTQLANTIALLENGIHPGTPAGQVFGVIVSLQKCPTLRDFQEEGDEAGQEAAE